MTERECRMCHETKELTKNFYPSVTGRDGYRTECKRCSQTFPSQQDKGRKIQKFVLRNKQYMWDFYSSHACVDCGEDDPVVLELDHRDPTTKRMNLGAMANNTFSLASIQAEIDKCDVVCANCHRRRTAKMQGWYQNIEGGPQW